MSRFGNIAIFSGSSHPELTRAICEHLGLPVGKSETVKFSNGNLMPRIHENVRDRDVFIVQTMAPPVNDGLMETFLMIDALKGASAGRVTAVLPCFPYARSDKKDQPRISIGARLVADLLQTAGADRVLSMDLHSPQIQGFFHIPVDQLVAAKFLCERMRAQWDLKDCVLVAGDVGEAKELGRFANILQLPVAVVDKRRHGNDDKAVATNLIGDVQGRHAIIVDDEIATGGTIIEATNFLLQRGALSVRVVATHGVLSGPAIDRINGSQIQEVLITDTVPLQGKVSDKIKVVSVAGLFAEVIQHIHDGESVSELF